MNTLSLKQIVQTSDTLQFRIYLGLAGHKVDDSLWETCCSNFALMKVLLEFYTPTHEQLEDEIGNESLMLLVAQHSFILPVETQRYIVSMYCRLFTQFRKEKQYDNATRSMDLLLELIATFATRFDYNPHYHAYGEIASPLWCAVYHLHTTLLDRVMHLHPECVHDMATCPATQFNLLHIMASHADLEDSKHDSGNVSIVFHDETSKKHVATTAKKTLAKSAIVMTILNLHFNHFDDLINAPNDCGQTPLHIACLHKRIDMIKLLLKHGADPNLQDIHGRTAIHFACSFADEQPVDNQLFKQTVSTLFTYSKRYPADEEGNVGNSTIDLSIKCKRGASGLMMLLVGKPDERDFYKRDDIFKLCCETDCTHLLTDGYAPVKGNTILHALASMNHPRALDYLLGTYSKYACVDILNDLDETPLQVAIEAQRLEASLMLLHYGADIDQLDRRKIRAMLPTYSTEFLEFLLVRSILDVHDDDDGGDGGGAWLLYQTESLDSLKMLLRYGASVEQLQNRKDHGWIVQGSYEKLELFIEHGYIPGEVVVDLLRDAEWLEVREKWTWLADHRFTLSPFRSDGVPLLCSFPAYLPKLQFFIDTFHLDPHVCCARQERNVLYYVLICLMILIYQQEHKDDKTRVIAQRLEVARYLIHTWHCMPPPGLKRTQPWLYDQLMYIRDWIATLEDGDTMDRHMLNRYIQQSLDLQKVRETSGHVFLDILCCYC